MEVRAVNPGSATVRSVQRESVQSLERGFNILQHMADPRLSRGATVTDLARDVGLHKSTAYRILDTLRQQGFVRQDADSGRYSLGYSVLNIAAQFLNNAEIRGVASSELRELASASGHSVHLAVWDRGEVVYLDKVDKGEWTRTVTNVGMRSPAHCTASGRAILAHLPEEAIGDAAARVLSAPTLDDIRSEVDLRATLQETRMRGYALIDHEATEGAREVAAPVFDYRGRVAAAIGISDSANALSQERMEELAPMVVMAANRISQRLGHGV